MSILDTLTEDDWTKLQLRVMELESRAENAHESLRAVHKYIVSTTLLHVVMVERIETLEDRIKELEA